MPMEQHGPDPQFEQTFSEAIGRSADAYDTAVGPLVDSGWSYGRRLRRRRRIGTAAGAAALALVAVGGAAAGGVLPGRRAPEPAGAATAPSVATVPGPELARMVTALLPGGAVVVADTRGTESRAPLVRLVLDDGGGRAQVLAWITRAPKGVRPDCATGPTMTDPCRLSDNPADNVMTHLTGPHEGERGGPKVWTSVVDGDGYQVLVQEWNGEPLDPRAQITREDPPLTVDQLERVARDPGWQRVAAALPEGPGISVWPPFAPEAEGDSPPGARSFVVPPALPAGPAVRSGTAR